PTTMAAWTGLPSHIASASSSAGTARGWCTVDDNRALSTVTFGPSVASTLVSLHLESIVTQSGRMDMSCLLAGRGRCVMHRDRSRHQHLYVRWQVFGRPDGPISGLMRHLCEVASIEVLLLPRAVMGSTGLGLLVATPRGPDRFSSRRFRAQPGAVAISVVTPRAAEEHLAAPGADHKPQRKVVRVGPILYTAGGGATLCLIASTTATPRPSSSDRPSADTNNARPSKIEPSSRTWLRSFPARMASRA